MKRTQMPVLLAYPFRPFFLLTALYGALIVTAWLGFLYGGLSLPVGIPLVQWHAHEMLFGLVPAAIAGFLLTALTNWTGSAPLTGWPLLALILLWAAGRLVLWLSAILPAPFVAAVDLAFLPVLGGYVFRVLQRHGNRRNVLLAMVIGAMTLANLCMHASFLGYASPTSARVGEVLALDLITVLMIIIAGRITPLFTMNWLRVHGGDPAVVYRSEILERTAVVVTIALIPADLAGLWLPWLSALVALLAAGVHLLRLVRWSGWHTRSEPLLWILHVGYAWIVTALLLKGLAPLTSAVPSSAWFHALGAGAIGALILGVMTRVSVGHTGRELQLRPGGLVIYLAVLAGGVLRVSAALGSPAFDSWLLLLAGLCWSGAFILFLIMYWPILSKPRVDNRPG